MHYVMLVWHIKSHSKNTDFSGYNMGIFEKDQAGTLLGTCFHV